MRSLMKRGAAMVVLPLTLVASVALAGPPHPKATAEPVSRLVGVVNINTATPEQLQLLPGVGPARARAIVEDRKTKGPYRSPKDLTRVSGIGERALLRMQRHLAVSGKTTARAQD
ncbi:MAG: ComEA family DNA-binding protein [Myxococcota bacterium]